jgi:hypothetical protein
VNPLPGRKVLRIKPKNKRNVTKKLMRPSKGKAYDIPRTYCPPSYCFKPVNPRVLVAWGESRIRSKRRTCHCVFFLCWHYLSDSALGVWQHRTELHKLLQDKEIPFNTHFSLIFLVVLPDNPICCNTHCYRFHE